MYLLTSMMPIAIGAVCRWPLLLHTIPYDGGHMHCRAWAYVRMQIRRTERLINRGWIVTYAFKRIPEGEALSYFYKPKPLSSFRRFSFHLVLLHELVLYISGHRSMLKVLHREFSLTLSQGTELCRISKHVC